MNHLRKIQNKKQDFFHFIWRFIPSQIETINSISYHILSSVLSLSISFQPIQW